MLIRKSAVGVLRFWKSNCLVTIVIVPPVFYPERAAVSMAAAHKKYNKVNKYIKNK